VRTRTSLVLIAAGILLVLFLAVDAIFDLWGFFMLQSAMAVLFTAGLWIVSGISFNSIEQLATQTDEVIAGRRAAYSVKTRSTDVLQLLAGMEEMLLRLQASKKAMHQFLGDASHELRTPLTVISAYLQLLEQPQTQQNPEYLAKSLAKMTTEANRMQRLIDDLLQLAEIGENAPLGKSEPVDISRLLTFELESLGDLQPERPITSNIAGTVFVKGNADLLAQLCANLFANLRRHTAATAPVQVDLVTGATWVSITVNDGGPGLSDDAYAAGVQHFQRYDQSRSRESGGSGLGMSIMASIVERHGGQISLSKSVLGGLCTRITLPV
jgi:signal transduction histidine kinase